LHVLSYFEWLNNLTVSTAIRESVWMSPLVNVAHLAALVMFIGAVLIVDLKLLGNDEGTPVSAIARGAEPWLLLGFFLLFLTGVPQLISNALREYYSVFFWFKMVVMVVALIFTFTIRRRVTLAPEGQFGAGARKLVGALSILLWGSVAIPARLIGLFT
jgi:hypothetical protein